MNKYLSNNKILKDRRREQRKSQTPAEKLMWLYLRGKKLSDFHFVRQYSLGPYILDFYCPRIKLAIEIDGPIHDSSGAVVYDKEREAYLRGQSVKIVRFRNEEVISNTKVVIKRLEPLLSIREAETKSE